jgi:O-antigen ligase
MFKSLIDASWENRFLGVNCLQIIGVFLPLLIFPRIIFSKNSNFFKNKLAYVALFYLFTNLLGCMALIAEGRYNVASEVFFRVLNGTLGFFMFQVYFSDRDSFKRLLLALLIAGLFPMSMGIYQVISGKLWHIRETAGGLIRNVGLYHDAFGIRAYGFQTLTAILLIRSYFFKKRTFWEIIMAIYALLWCVIIFKSYSKAAVVIFATWIISWSFFNRKILLFLFVLFGLVIVNIATGNKIFGDVQTLFQKEIGAYEGTMDSKYILAGRTIGWKALWEAWKKKGIFQKTFGTGHNPPAHNEYLRILYVNGVFGLLSYIAILLIIGIKVLAKMIRGPTPLNVMAFMIFSMWFVDTIGLHPGLYPSYQWYVWGFLTLGLKGVKELDEKGIESKPVFISKQFQGIKRKMQWRV